MEIINEILTLFPRFGEVVWGLAACVGSLLVMIWLREVCGALISLAMISFVWKNMPNNPKSFQPVAFADFFCDGGWVALLFIFGLPAMPGTIRDKLYDNFPDWYERNRTWLGDTLTEKFEDDPQPKENPCPSPPSSET